MTNLDQSQLDFCQSDAQNIRLLAPAGCGKTISLLYRCRELAERSDSRQRFLIVTFTRAAAAELKDRLIRETQFESIRDIVHVTTLNAYGYRRIRDQVGTHELLDTSTKKRKAMLTQLKPIWENNQYVKPVVTESRNNAVHVMEAMDGMKSMGFDHTRDTSYELFVERVENLAYQRLYSGLYEQALVLTDIGLLESPDDYFDFYTRFFKFWLEATPKLLEESTFTFEDQKYWTYLRLTHRSPDQKAQRPVTGAARYHHVMVDEFQDINPLDLSLVKALADRNQATLTIVGDDDQAIFEWRGATPEYILNPSQYFDVSFRGYTLGVNYRSPKNIVDLSQRLISNNENRVHKKVRAAEDASIASIELKQTHDIHEHLKLVTEIVRSTEPGKVAVISRLRRQLIPYEIHFASDGAPFRIAKDLNILSSRAFNNLVKLLEIRADANEQRRRNKAIDDAVEICNFIKRYRLSISKDRPNLEAYLRKARPCTTAEAISMIKDYDGAPLKGSEWVHLDMYESASEFVNAGKLSDAIRVIEESFKGLRFDYEKAEEDVYYTAPPLEQLAQIVESEDLDVDDLIERIETSKKQIEEYRSFEQNSDTGDQGGMLQRPLHLMTAPRSKGKEFDTVIILDAVEGIWPHHRVASQREMEAERRLFYVAFTRARKRVVFLTEEDATLSPFVKELGLEDATE